MPFTTLTPIVCPGPFGTAGVVVTLTALDNTNGNQFLSTGHEVLLVFNSDGAGAHTVTVNSQPDKEGRTASLTLSVPLSSYVITQLFPVYGWAAGGYITMPTGQDATLQVAVLQLSF